MFILLWMVRLILFIGLGCGLSSGATFYPISSVTSDTVATDFFTAQNLIQGAGVGFDASEPHNQLGTGGAAFTWVTDAPNGGAGDYFSPLPGTSPRFVFDLGSVVALNEVSVWGYADSNGNGLISADLRFSDTPTFSGDVTSISGITQPYAPRQSFSFDDVDARYVEFVPTDNLFGIAPPGGDRAGLGEVAFAVPIPEPSSALLCLLGLAGLARRRR